MRDQLITRLWRCKEQFFKSEPQKKRKKNIFFVAHDDYQWFLISQSCCIATARSAAPPFLAMTEMIHEIVVKGSYV